MDTSVWSLLLRRDQLRQAPEVRALVNSLEAGEPILSTGLVLQELLQGFSGPKARQQIIERFAAFPLLNPDRQDHIAAAELRNRCRKRGVQVGTIDALIAQLCIRHDLLLLTADADFSHIARHEPLTLREP
ncbi:MAG TPA: PIN domain-containing protein [Steroidobacteraceae bacterium]|nr:PIN domain-containing protein [Steroidobacteraceae bacterium]